MNKNFFSSYFIRYILIISLGFVSVFFVEYNGLFEGIDNYFYDLSFRFRGNRHTSEPIIIVGIDERTLAKYGRWPIKRSRYVELLDILKEAKVVGFNISLSEATEDDLILGRAIRRHGRVVLPAYIDRQLKARLPVKAFSSARVGHVHLEQGIDGIVRQVFHRISCKGLSLPSFSSAIVELVTISGFDHGEGLPSGFINKPDCNYILQANRMNINFYGGPGTFFSVSLADVISGKWSSSFFKDKIVLVGVTSVGITEGILTPFSQDRSRVSSVEAHAQIVGNLLDQQEIKAINQWLRLLIVLAVFLFSFFLYLKFTVIYAALIWIIGLIVLVILDFTVFSFFNLWFNPSLLYIAPTFAFVIAYIISLERMGILLRKAKEDWEQSFNTINEAITIYDRDCNLLRANQTAEKTFGSPLLDLLSHRCLRFRLEAHSKEGIPKLETVFSSTLNRHLEIKSLPRFDENGEFTGMVQLVRDITDRINAENEHQILQAQLQQSQKMEAIGTLAGGVAHDFNNLLTTIIGYAEIMLMQVDKDSRLRDGIEEIKKASDRATSLTSQLLAFSRKQMVQPVVLNINRAMAEMDKMLHRLIGEDIDLVTILEPELWKIKFDAGQMDQVVMNLAVNAKDAMPKGGKLTIETANVDLDEVYARQHGIELKTGPFVVLAVSDTGMGIDEETQSHIFEPFFTTKGKGKGTGLGLSTVYGIVKQSGGYIWVYSEPGHGTTFKIYLPKTKEEEAFVAEGQMQPQNLEGNETIMLAEDDDAARKLIRSALQEHGYWVLEAQDGKEALQLIAHHKGPIHLLLTDVVMP